MNEFKELFRNLAIEALQSGNMSANATGKINITDGTVVEFEMNFDIIKLKNADGETWELEHE